MAFIHSHTSVTHTAPAARTAQILPARRLRPQHFAALTGLRAVLAIWVIAHHLIGSGLGTWSKVLPGPAARLMDGGYLAVQTFFILSGFVLAHGYGAMAWDKIRL